MKLATITRGFAARTVVLAAWIAPLVVPVITPAQKPEYEFHFEYRTEFSRKLQEENNGSLTKEDVLRRYADKLRKEGVAETEITRRLTLIRTDQAALDADYYSRYYLDKNSNFNHSPNAFLTEVVKDLRPGVPLTTGWDRVEIQSTLRVWDGKSGGSILPMPVWPLLKKKQMRLV